MVSAPAAQGRLTYTVPEGIEYITYRLGVTGAGNSITYSDLQIERSSEPTIYEPYTPGDTLSLSVDEAGYLTPISPFMNVFTRSNTAILCGEFLKSGAVASATELILSDPSHKASTHVTSAEAVYAEEESRLLIKLFNGDSHISSVDMTDAMRAFISKEITGGTK